MYALTCLSVSQYSIQALDFFRLNVLKASTCSSFHHVTNTLLRRYNFFSRMLMEEINATL